MKLIRTIALMLIAAGAAIVADRTYRARTNPASVEWIEDAKFDQIEIDHLQFDREPLSSALRKLSDKSGVAIVLDTQELQARGLNSEMPVSVSLHHVALSDALHQILHTRLLDYTLDRGCIVVSTFAKLQAKTILRVYSIDDIIRAMDKNGIPAVRPAIPNGQFFLFNGVHRIEDQDTVDAVVKLIEDSVDPDIWRDNGGTEGHIRELNHRLFIQASWRHQQEIARLLREIRGGARPKTTAQVLQ